MMRAIKNILIPVVAIVLLASCQKRRCYKCETLTRLAQGMAASEVHGETDEIVCDKTKKEIQAYEAQLDENRMVNMGGEVVQQRTFRHCYEQ